MSIESCVTSVVNVAKRVLIALNTTGLAVESRLVDTHDWFMEALEGRPRLQFLLIPYYLVLFWLTMFTFGALCCLAEWAFCAVMGWPVPDPDPGEWIDDRHPFRD